MAKWRRGGDRRRAFEWKVIRIPYSVLYVTFAIIFLAVGSLGLYYFRDSLPFPLPATFQMVFEKLGAKIGARQGMVGGGDESFIERRYATLSFLTGDVKVQRSKSMNWISAQLKMKLETGDRVRTFGGSRAEVLFDDGSVLKIKSDSLIVIGDLMENVKTKVRKSSVRLMVSSIEADIKKSVVEGSQFRLEMPSAVAEMDRAKISVQVGPEKNSDIRVYSGNVDVDTGERRLSVGDLSRVSVGPGSDVSEVTQILPVPKIYSPEMLTKLFFNREDRISFTVKWKPVKKAVGYHLQMDNDRRFLHPELDQTDIDKEEYVVSGLTPGVYYAHVSALDLTAQQSLFSEPVAFMIVLDKTPPGVEVQKFVSSKAPGGYDIYLEGQTEPAVEIMLAGRTIVVDEQGRFSASLRGIPPGRSEVQLLVKDRAGNETSLSLAVAGGA